MSAKSKAKRAERLRLRTTVTQPLARPVFTQENLTRMEGLAQAISSEYRDRVLDNDTLKEIADSMARGQSERFNRTVEKGIQEGIAVFPDMYNAAEIGIRDWRKQMGLENNLSKERER